jgi:GNAT superfamily N-acetyltransferase
MSVGRSARRNGIAAVVVIWSATGMDQDAVLRAYDEQIRRDAAGPDGHTERDAHTTRFVYDDGSWAGVLWSDLDESNADEVIAEQVRRFADRTEPWEWKYYSYDGPADLPDRLLAAGFTREPDEAVLVAEIADLDLDASPPPGVEFRPVTDQADADALDAVHDAAFDETDADIGQHILAGLAHDPPTVAGVVAWAGDTPVSAARIEFYHGTEFAGLFGGGTLPAWRRRGIFSALVAYRAAIATELGFRYLQVDAMPMSRPILQRLGFVEVATTIPFNHPGRSGGSGGSGG